MSKLHRPRPTQLFPGLPRNVFWRWWYIHVKYFLRVISGNERSEKPCRPFGERWWTGFSETNEFFRD